MTCCPRPEAKVCSGTRKVRAWLWLLSQRKPPPSQEQVWEGQDQSVTLSCQGCFEGEGRSYRKETQGVQVGKVIAGSPVIPGGTQYEEPFLLRTSGGQRKFLG